jgi:hypothetical protein
MSLVVKGNATHNHGDSILTMARVEQHARDLNQEVSPS